MKTENARIGSESQHTMTSIYPQRVRFGPFEADLETHELWKNGVKVKLGGQPFEILALLLDRPGQMVSREELQKEIWAADTFVDFNHGLNAAVNKLRETLCDSAEEPKYIETLPRRGYRFIGQIEKAVSELKFRKAAPATEFVQQSSPVPTAAERESTSRLGQALKTIEEAGKLPISRKFLVLSAAGAAVSLALWWLALGPVNFDPERKQRAVEAERTEALSKMFTLVPDPASDPAISPDGKLVAFRRNSYAPGAAGIFVTSSDGKGLTQLTVHPGDCCPAWSPDGKSIAFSRISTDEYGIYLVSAAGGAAQKVSHEDPRKKRGELGWTADGKFIAFSGDSPQGGSQIFLLSVQDSSVQPLTEPQGQDRDWGPAFSPDGTRMAFVRTNGAGFPEEIFVMALNGSAAQDAYRGGNTPAASGPATQLTSLRAAIMGPPAWLANGAEIIFASTKAGEPALWRVPVAGGEATPIEKTGTATWHPTVARKDGNLVVQKILRASGIYHVDLQQETAQRTKTIVTSTNGRNEGPTLSPDGKKLVFMSDRSGSLEIWVSNRDGSAPAQLTNLHGCGTPRWSPDGMWIAFDTVGNGAQGVYVIPAMGGTPRAVVTDAWENSVPSWSRDGKWIYFGSRRSGEDQVWKIPVAGGKAVQVTHDGGFAAWESLDGKTLYYAKTRFENPEIWQMPVGGGTERNLSGTVRPKSWAAWSVTNQGIYFCPHEGASDFPSVAFFDFESRLTRQLSLLDKSPFWMSVTPDGKEMFYDQAGQDESSILLVQSYQ
ncbi:MAG TPA: winged helix-turn-helix domain-containing protein [Candidatus Bathyarchaeia archaeon]|nr:winged helix-turn-helix domain-containing protein [Candidatus Bathyarchaeia archaeon]